MGSSISGILANLFMDKLETVTLSSHLLISPYKRYVDDLYLRRQKEKRQTNSTIQWIYIPNWSLKLRNRK